MPIHDRPGRPALPPAQVKKSKSYSLSQELIDHIKSLPQIKTPVSEDGWSESYFVEQVLRISLELPSDYDQSDISQIVNGRIIV